MNERRAERRQRVLKKGKIVFNDRYSVLDCRIRDLTPGGARLVLDNTLYVPSEFSFIDTVSRIERLARLVWRTEAEIGVAFAPPGTLGTTPDGDGRKIVPFNSVRR